MMRQIAPVSSPNVCGTFANDAAAGNLTTGTTTGPNNVSQALAAGSVSLFVAGAASTAAAPMSPPPRTHAFGLPPRATPLADGSLPLPPPQVLFVLGGPGAGKGTQCSRLVYVWRHSAPRFSAARRALSALRKERRRAAAIAAPRSIGHSLPAIF